MTNNNIKIDVVEVARMITSGKSKRGYFNQVIKVCAVLYQSRMPILKQFFLCPMNYQKSQFQ
jgi:hypothetical protein